MARTRWKARLGRLGSRQGDRHKPRGRGRGHRFLRRLKLQEVDFRQHGHAPWCALTVSGQGGAFGSLAAAALRAGASADSGISPGTKIFFAKKGSARLLDIVLFPNGGMNSFDLQIALVLTFVATVTLLVLSVWWASK